jgi:hypothetical protein
MRNTARKRVLAAIVSVALAVLVVLGGCDSATGPDTGVEPAVSLSFSRAAGAADITAADSVVVRVFRTSGVPEAVKGVAISADVSDVRINVSCTAENGKRVSVELFEGGLMTHHGVNPDVDVTTNRTTNATVDVYDFVVSALTVTPAIILEGEVFDLSWDGAPAATFYRVQASATADFGTIEWDTSLPDTTLKTSIAPGAHYFRVAPRTAYAQGTYAPAQPGYVVSSGGRTVINGFDPPAAPPGGLVAITGENLDFPGIQVYVGAVLCRIVSVAWNRIDVELPRAARTGFFTVTSPLDGGDTSPAPFFVQRLAYVTATGLHAAHYLEYIGFYADEIEYSGVAVLGEDELDTRDMSAFDVIIVASDMGTTRSNWGGGQPGRAQTIAGSGADVLAIGLGGAVYLDLIASTLIPGLSFSSTTTQFYHVPDGSEPIWNDPHWVLDPGDSPIQFCAGSVTSITLDIDGAAKPLGVNLYAAAGMLADRWTLADVTLLVNSTPVRHFLWGFAGDPYALTQSGADCFSNVVYLLYNRSAPAPAAGVSPSASR